MLIASNHDHIPKPSYFYKYCHNPNPYEHVLSGSLPAIIEWKPPLIHIEHCSITLYILIILKHASIEY